MLYLSLIHIFEHIINFFKNIGKNGKENSKETAKERLHLVLAQDRANISADFHGSANSIACCNIMLNAAVAESLRQYADKLEKAKDFDAALPSLIRQTIKDRCV